jgi:lactase-phlorizin hydrolase
LSQNWQLSKNILSGKVGITLNMDWCQPFNATNDDHIHASMTKLQFQGGWFANPIFVNGQYPDVMREKVKEFTNILSLF